MSVFPVPYFLVNSTLNHHEAKDSFEFWFVLEGGGSQAHADAYCETTISLQLRGSKRWRLGAFPNITNAFQPYSFHDAEIYSQDHFWRPEHEEVVTAGQCVVFPMGYIHETYVADGDAGEDGCSVATTFQFQDPQAVLQWRNFLTRWGLSHYAREEPCIERMEPYVYLGQAVSKGRDDEALREACKKPFAAADLDGDGRVSVPEMEHQFGRGRPFAPPWTEVKDRHVLRRASAEKIQWMAEDAVLFHDTDGDLAVSLTEFQDSVIRFRAVRRRLMKIRGRGTPKALYDEEREWISKYLCVNAQGSGDGDPSSCEALQQLDRDFQEQFGKRKKKRRKNGPPRNEL